MLAIDTTGIGCAVAYKSATSTICLESEPGQKNTDAILHLINQVCLESDIKLSEIEHVIITNGPGTFTGVRVGVIVAQILSLASSCKLYSVSSSMALAYSANKLYGDGLYGIYQDARMSELYFAIYEFKNKLCTTIQNDSRVLIGTTDPQEVDFKIANFTYEHCKFIKNSPEIMLEIISSLKPVKPEALQAIYLRDPV